MVSTRHHPRPFPEPTLTASSPSSPTKDTPPSPTTSSASTTKRRSTSRRRVAPSSDSVVLTPSKPASRRKKEPATSHIYPYVHNPPSLLLTWLLISLPLVIWDTLYIMGRPHTMPGGKFHSPFWTPYALYGTIDHVYGWPAWNANDGFTAAQGSLNIVETVMYGWYLFIMTRESENGWRGILKKLWREGSEGKVTVQGKGVDLAVLICFSSAALTLSKTILYWLNEAFSGFAKIGHNNALDLIVLWIIPNGAWIALPTYMLYILGGEILATMRGEGPTKDD